jgi:methyl-accepting chemotaxis protein
MLPDTWKSHGAIRFVNKHNSPLDSDVIVALVAPVTASFSASYQLGTIVMAYHWAEIISALPDQSLLLFHQDIPVAPESTPSIPSHDNRLPNPAHTDILFASTLASPVPNEALLDLAHNQGWVQAGNKEYLVNSASEKAGMLSGWEVVMLREPESLHQTIQMVILKLAILGLIMTLPLIFAIRWLAGRLTAPLVQLTQFVSEITGTQDLSKRLELHSEDEIGILAADFNLMTARLASGSKAHREAEMRLRATIDNALDAVVQMNPEGIITG